MTAGGTDFPRGAVVADSGRSRWLLPWLYLVAAVLTSVILAPLLRPGYLLYRDAVSTPHSFVTDATLGLGELPPRAVPQDWLVASIGSLFNGGVVVTGLLCAAMVFGGVGYGLLAIRLVPECGRTGAIAATMIAICNPYVAERLLQGHWSLLVGYATLGWIIMVVNDFAPGRGVCQWLALGGLLAAAGLTPTGSVLAGAVLVVTAVACAPWRRVEYGGALLLWLASTAPWLLAAVIGGASIGGGGMAGVNAFGLRAEPWLGSLGTALGLGGIWNADAVPASRTFGWAAVATGCFLAVAGLGLVSMWHRGMFSRPAVALGLLAMVTVFFAAAGATGPGRITLGALIDAVPGGGLLRDTQKFLALAMPFVAICVGSAARALHARVPAGFALVIIGLLTVAPLPDIAWGVGGRLSTVHYPADWSRVAALIPADSGSVALWPPGTVRRYTFTRGPSLDPAARMLRAPVIESGELTVDGTVVDPPAPHALRVHEALRAGGDPITLARLGVGWVLIENDSSPTHFDIPIRLAQRDQPIFSGTDLTLFRIPGAARLPGPTTAARTAMWLAHLAWAGLAVTGLGAGIIRGSRKRRETHRR
ncbi:MAG: hypothetical protein QM673_14020 [Gordonia sp. (in: high G+C Gram-positive bacteria)]